MLLIAGGDRHGMEPNANINLTNARSFTEFVQEIRYEQQSHVLFMPQYAEPWKHRILESTLDAIRNYPDFPLGSRMWDERVWHPDQDGVVRPLKELWPDGTAPRWMTLLLRGVPIEHRERRLTLGKAIRLGHLHIHHKPLAMIHQHVAHVVELGALVLTFAKQFRFRVGRQ